MPVSAWVALLTVAVGTVVTLTVASMQRKQMRQIEMHRADPSLPLVPPPGPIIRLLKTYGFYFLLAGGNFVGLIHELRQTGPVTRQVVFSLVLYSGGVGVGIFLALLTFVFGGLMKLIASILDVFGRQIAITEKTVTVMEAGKKVEE